LLIHFIANARRTSCGREVTTWGAGFDVVTAMEWEDDAGA